MDLLGGECRPRSDCTYAQSDLALLSPLFLSLVSLNEYPFYTNTLLKSDNVMDNKSNLG